MYINVNLKKPDHRGISQILATPGEGREGDGLSRFSLYTLASLSLLKTTYLCRTYTVSKREKVIKWHLNRHWLILGI